MTILKRQTLRFKRALLIIRNEGFISFLIMVLNKMKRDRQRKTTNPTSKLRAHFLVKQEDAMAADWSSHPYKPTKKKIAPPYRINWVMSPPDTGLGGGHQNIFRFMHFLESQGHECRVYLYSSNFYQSAEDAQAVIRKFHPASTPKVRWLDGPMEEADAIFATGWETAYPVFSDPSKARRFYFVQDFEPYFYPIGSEYVLAENTYKMNFHGITAGGWLSKKLSTDYGMACDNYDFGVDLNRYTLANKGKRKEIFFYARPITARRGFELGIMALQIFHEKMPDYTINLAGWDVSEYDIPFPYVNMKSLSLDELNEVYNKCAAALVISLTNMSLLPLELLAAGTIPVVNDGANNRLVSDNPFIAYSDSSPSALADTLIKAVTRKDAEAYAAKAAASVEGSSWQESCEKFEKVITRELHG